MTEREKQLFNMISEDENPQEALIIATRVICDFLELLEKSQDRHPEVL
jgi:hypothetical protein